ncbi:hypothetical protein OQA88_9424 [Cercophora sp. LCS_1]
MRLMLILSSLGPALAAVLPEAAAPRNFRVVGSSVLGTGCPYGTASVRVDPGNTAFEISLSDYIVKTGPNTMASDWRKNCKLTLNLSYDPGYSYANLLFAPHFSTLAADIKGYASIPPDTQGHCENTVDFTGAADQASYSLTIPGGRDGPFSLSARTDIVSWSPCGGSTAILNMNTQCWISPTQSPGIDTG